MTFPALSRSAVAAVTAGAAGCWEEGLLSCGAAVIAFQVEWAQISSFAQMTHSGPVRITRPSITTPVLVTGALRRDLQHIHAREMAPPSWPASARRGREEAGTAGAFPARRSAHRGSTRHPHGTGRSSPRGSLVDRFAILRTPSFPSQCVWPGQIAEAPDRICGLADTDNGHPGCGLLFAVARGDGSHVIVLMRCSFKVGVWPWATNISIHTRCFPFSRMRPCASAHSKGGPAWPASGHAGRRPDACGSPSQPWRSAPPSGACT